MKTPLTFKTLRRQVREASAAWRREAYDAFKCGFRDGPRHGLETATCQAYTHTSRSPGDRKGAVRYRLLYQWFKGRGALRRRALTLGLGL